MLDVMFPERPLRVVVHQSVIDGLKVFRQIGKSDVEACGILLGKVYDGAVEITHYTVPQQTDRRSRCGYVRDRAGHLEAAMQIWEKSGKLIGYVGEWHTHPESHPAPSSKDISEAKKIAKANLERLIAIILGKVSGCIFVVDNRTVTLPISFTL